MEKAYTTTVFYLAQAYGAIANSAKAAMYCHYTMARQLISRKEFSHKDWTTNALRLSGFYLREMDYASAMYFIEAARQMVPREGEEGKEAVASLHLSEARYHRIILCHSVEAIQPEEGADPIPAPTPDRTAIATR